MWTSFIGFMASGKSSVTSHLQSVTSRPLASVDHLVAQRSGLSIPQIFQTQGESRFREMELEVLRELDGERPLVVDTGGGIVETPAAVELLRHRGVIIWLDAPWEVFRQRLRTGEPGSRPLVDRLGWAGLEELFQNRRRLYAAAADFRISGKNRTVAELSRIAMLRSLIWERRQEGKGR
jgi:shikimate kinase